MIPNASTPYRHFPLVVTLMISCTANRGVHGQEIPGITPTFLGQPLVPPQVIFQDGGSRSAGPLNATGRTSWIRLFRMPTAFINDPVGLDVDDGNPAVNGEPVPNAVGPGDLFGDSRMGLAAGSDNPFFDFRAPGDPGGVGYYRVHTQYQLFADRCTCCSFGLQAYAPAGLESDGVANGPTVFSPNLALFHEWWEGGLAVQGFVGKTVMARPGWTDSLGRHMHCGLALQSPLPNLSRPSGPCVHLFVEALGFMGRFPDNQPNRGVNWGVIPGLHCRLRENWWMSSGLVLPVGTTRYETGMLQITCSWRF